MTHEEILAQCQGIAQRYLDGAMENAMDDIWEILESANYVVQDDDEDYMRADNFLAFIFDKIVREWDKQSDPFAKGGE